MNPNKTIIGELRKKYSLKSNVPIDKLSKIMTPDDHKKFMEAITFPNGKPSENAKNVPDHLREVPNDSLDGLRYLFRDRNFTKGEK